jgi:AhpD family alkylhydroperoxidase
MYTPGGLSRAERELGSTVIWRQNACVYCASVRAQRFEQWGKRNDAIAQVFENPCTVSTSPRDKAIADFAIVLDLLHSVAIFAWASQLARGSRAQHNRVIWFSGACPSHNIARRFSAQFNL